MPCTKQHSSQPCSHLRIKKFHKSNYHTKNTRRSMTICFILFSPQTLSSRKRRKRVPEI
ncbi:hypothetical protein BC830DRAFT_1156124, partial [Chytriomyces sp. MP71]